MHPSSLPDGEKRRLGALLTSGGVLSLALSSTAGLQTFRGGGGRWRFGALHLDGERGHVPEGVFGAVAVEDVVTLTISNLGVTLFKELVGCSFERLQHLRFTDCLFETAGAHAVALLVNRHAVRSLELRRCFLAQAELEVLSAAAAPLERLLLAETGLRVEAGDAMGSLLQRSQICDLTLQGRFELQPGFLDAIAAHAPLRVLRLTDNGLLSDDVVRRLCDSLARRGTACSRLSALDLSASGGAGTLTDVGGRALGGLLSMPHGPESLRAAGHRLTKASLAACLGACASGLLSADFTGNDLGGDVALDPDLAKAVATSRLRSLSIGGGQGKTVFDYTEDEGDDFEQTPLSTVAWVSGALPSLVRLDASHANIDDGALAAFASAMAGMSVVALTELDVSSNFITEDGAEALVDGLRRAGVRLRRLDLSVNQLGDDGCRTVFDALLPGAALASVQRLSLRANSLGDVRPLRAALRGCCLRELDLRENLLTDADVQQVLAEAEGRRRAHSLHLRLEGNELCEEEWTDVELKASPGEQAGEAEGRVGPDVLAEPGGPSAGEIRVSNLNLIGPDIDCRVGVRKARSVSFAEDLGGAGDIAGEAAWEGPPLRSEANEGRRGGAETPPSPSAWEREQAWDGPALQVSREEWQDCLDSLAFMESCIKK